MKKVNVLSLFDGMSCGRVALNYTGHQIDRYYTSETDKYASAVSRHNYPDNIELGDITKWRNWRIDFKEIDLILAGFPCQAWSVAGKQQGTNDSRGDLVHDLLAIKDKITEANPSVKFLFENVRMKKEFLDYISGLFGVQPVLIDSQLVSAQRRKRFYWTNINNGDISQPEDKGVLLKDIVHENTVVDRDKSYALDATYYKGSNKGKLYFLKSRRQIVLDIIKQYIIPKEKSLTLLENETKAGKIGYFNEKDSQGNRVYSVHGKSVTLCGDAGGLGAKTGLYLFGCITPDRPNKRQNGQRFNDGKKFYTLTAQDRHGIITEGYIRKLTPVECERLQTLDDGYTEFGKFPDKEVEKISDTQRYKMIGNGWTVGVVSHILNYLKTGD